MLVFPKPDHFLFFFQDADGIRRVAGDTKYEAAQLRGQAGEHAGQVAATDQRMKGFEDEADNDGILSKEVFIGISL